MGNKQCFNCGLMSCIMTRSSCKQLKVQLRLCHFVMRFQEGIVMSTFKESKNFSGILKKGLQGKIFVMNFNIHG